MSESTCEPQYNRCLELRDTVGVARFGLMYNQAWHDDPRHLLFLFSRYKFVSKMFSGFERVLDVGCADAFAVRLVLQEVKSLTTIDFDPVFIQDILDRMDKKWIFNARVHNIVSAPVTDGPYDGIYSLDVIEHIAKEQEELYLQNMLAALAPHGVMLIGTPSIQSQQYASPPSKAGHINCKDHKELKALMLKYFHNVFIFSMNDEVVHTGFAPMAHYLFALCCGKR